MISFVASVPLLFARGDSCSTTKTRTNRLHAVAPSWSVYRRLLTTCEVPHCAESDKDPAGNASSEIFCDNVGDDHHRSNPVAGEQKGKLDEENKTLRFDNHSHVVSRRYQYVSWGDVERMCKVLVEKLRGRRFDLVLAVTRGGMVPATLLAQALELRNVVTATVIFYTDGGDQFFGMTEPRFLSFPSADAIAGQNVLIVDDVWDSGRTARAVRKRALVAYAKSVTLTVLHYKPTQTIVTDVAPDFYAEDTENWVVYPWERISPHHAVGENQH